MTRERLYVYAEHALLKLKLLGGMILTIGAFLAFPVTTLLPLTALQPVVAVALALPVQLCTLGLLDVWSVQFGTWRHAY